MSLTQETIKDTFKKKKNPENKSGNKCEANDAINVQKYRKGTVKIKIDRLNDTQNQHTQMK